MWFLLLWFVGLLVSSIYFLINGFHGLLPDICRIVLLHQFVFTFGLLGVLGFISNVLFAHNTARRLSWPSGPFQIKYGFSQLTIGVLGVMTLWFKGSFWLAVLVSMYIYGISGLWTHIQSMRLPQKRLFHVGNIVMDILYQLFITVLFILAGGIGSSSA